MNFMLVLWFTIYLTVNSKSGVLKKAAAAIISMSVAQFLAFLIVLMNKMFCTLFIRFLKNMTMFFFKLTKTFAYPVVVLFTSNELLTGGPEKKKQFSSGSMRLM